MLYTCPCDQRVIDIPTKVYLFLLTDADLERVCTEGNGCQISNPFYGSFAETNGVILTPEQIEEINDAEHEEEVNPVNCDLNLPPDYYEE